MKWPWQKDACDHHLCQCHGLLTRQARLTEWGFEFLVSFQTRLTDYDKMMIGPAPVKTESVGLHGQPRDRRGTI